MEIQPLPLGSNGYPSSSWPALVQAAVAYGARGWSVIPLRGTQPNLADWRPYQSQRANEQCLRWWFSHPWHQAGVGIVCGPISYGLAALEIVDPLLAERLVQEGVEHLTRVVRTPGQGLHLYACSTETSTQTCTLIPQAANLKGAGAYVVAPPSSGYTIMSNEPIPKVPDVKTWAVALLARCGVVAKEDTQARVPSDQTANAQPLHGADETQQPQSAPTASPTVSIPPVQPAHERERGDFCPISLGHIADPGPRIDLVERLMPEGYSTVLFGDGGVCKSYLALEIATCVATGQPFAGLAVRPAAVLYLDWELNAAEFRRRGFSVARGLRRSSPPDNLYYVQMTQPFSRLIEHVKTFIHQHQIGLVILDSIGMACAGDPELARDVIGFFVLLKNLGVTVLAVDHQSKLQEGQSYAMKSPFGSVFKSNLSRSLIQVERLGGQDGWLNLRLHHKKLTFGSLSHQLGVTVQFDTTGEAETVRMSAWTPTQALATIEPLSDQDKIEHYLRQEGSATSDMLAQRTGVNPKTVSNHITRLRKAGKVKDVGSKGHAVIWAWVEAPVPNPAANASTPPTDGVTPRLTTRG